MMDLRRLLYVNAYQVYLGTLHSCGAPITRATHDVLTSPRPGHLVMEISTIYMPERDEWRFGRLLRRVDEPRYSADEWREQGARDDEPIPTQRAWYIELPDGREFRWDNAEFIRVLEDNDTARERVRLLEARWG